MCDPLSAIGAIGAVASAGMSYASAADLQNKQDQANNDWVAYQNKARQDAMNADTALRQKAEQARQQTLNTLDPNAQKAQQTAEQARLTTSMSGNPTPVTAQNVGDMLMSGQQSGGANFKTNIAQQITDASAAARQRIAALATIQSYGGSQFGLQNTNQNAFQAGDQAIGLDNNLRNGALQTYNVASQVQPEHYVQGSNIAGGIASALSGIAGHSAGTSLASAHV